MSIKFSSIVVIILSLFIAKISIENLGTAQAKEPTHTQSIGR